MQGLTECSAAQGRGSPGSGERAADGSRGNKKDLHGQVVFISVSLLCAIESAETTSADFHLLRGSVFLNSDGLNVRVELSSGMPVGVGNVVAGSLTLAANFTFSGHSVHLLFREVLILQ